MQTFKRHDTDSPLLLNVADATGAAVSVAGWTGYLNAVRVLDENGGAVVGPTITGTVTILDGAAGTSQYAWADGDLAFAGTYAYEVEWHKTGGKVQTTLGKPTFVVETDIADNVLTDVMPGGTIVVNSLTTDAAGAAIGTPPNGTRVVAYRDGEAVAADTVSTATWSLTLVAGSTYVLRDEFPGTPATPRTVTA